MSDTKKKTGLFTNKLYDQLKFTAQIVIPALGTCYAVVSGLWQWPNTEEVVGTLMAVDALLGTVLGLSSSRYNANEDNYDAVVHTATTSEGKQFLLEVDNPEVLDGKKSAHVMVVEH